MLLSNKAPATLDIFKDMEAGTVRLKRYGRVQVYKVPRDRLQRPLCISDFHSDSEPFEEVKHPRDEKVRAMIASDRYAVESGRDLLAN